MSLNSSNVALYDRILFRNKTFHLLSPITKKEFIGNMSLRSASKRDLTYYISRSIMGYKDYSDIRNKRGELYVIRKTTEKDRWYGVLKFVASSNQLKGLNENSIIQIIGPTSYNLNWGVFEDDLNKLYESISNKLEENLYREPERTKMIKGRTLNVYRDTKQDNKITYRDQNDAEYRSSDGQVDRQLKLNFST